MNEKEGTRPSPTEYPDALVIFRPSPVGTGEGVGVAFLPKAE